MAKNSNPDPSAHRGRLDLVGAILVAIALVWLVALFSYDRFDVRVNTARPNDPAHNWIGPVGAWWSELSFLAFGAAGFALPLALLAFGLGCLAEIFAFARRRWVWLVLLSLVSSVFFALNPGLVGRFASSELPGGLVGNLLNPARFIGYAGSMAACVLLYLLSLLGLSDFQLFEWIRMAWAERRERAEAALDEEIRLDRKARQLEKEARRLQELVDQERDTALPPPSLLGDAKSSGKGPAESAERAVPGPEPVVRDLSVPRAKPSAPLRKGSGPTPAAVLEGEVISAKEIAASSTPPANGANTPAKDSDAEADSDVGSAESSSTSGDEGPRSDSDPAGDDPMTQPVPTPPARGRMVPRRRLVVAQGPTIGNYKLPPIDLLQSPDLTIQPTESKEELIANARLMQQTLGQFGIDVTCGDITKGPTITRYELHPAPGVKLERITGLTNNIAAALKAERIHILAPVPGKSSVGVEVPNAVKTKVIMRDLLESEEWAKTRARIPLALGKDVYGHPMIADLAEAPHLLIAGSTGSGKSVCINSIIASLLYRFAPDQLRFVMIDPKVVELQQYNVLPHLVVPVVTDPKKVVLALRWVVTEMEKRYQIFAKMGVRNIKAFNERPKAPPPPKPSNQPELPLSSAKEKVEASQEGFAVQLDEEMVSADDSDIVIPEKLSYIVVIIDELADLMLVAPADVEMSIARITQMARAAGIHCIVATQRPSVDVITGVIKANIPARIAFQVASKVDSRTILDQMGADKLLGKGDMLYLPPGSGRLIRAQGALVTDQEIQSVVDFIAQQGKPSYELEITQQLQRPVRDSDDGDSEEDEELVENCIEVIRSEGKASTSLLQRRLKIGYGRAARMMDILEDRGIIGPARGAEPREILIDLDGQGHDGGRQQLV
ncbi:MAG: DNA translocase FtsK 4TM domain-containing protein [Limisphaerales bacterium]